MVFLNGGMHQLVVFDIYLIYKDTLIFVNKINSLQW